MAHMVEGMAYVGETPWHGLGNEVPEDLPIPEWMVEARLDWKIIKSKMWAASPISQPVDDYFALVRDTDKFILGICGKNYVPFQNEEVFGFFDKYTKAGKLRLNTAGSLDHGRIIWGLAKVNEFALGNDRIDGYLLLTQPHIWGKAMTVMFTTVRVVCMNTLTAALAGPGQRFSIPHIRAFDSELIQSIGEATGLADERMAEFKDKVTFLSTVKAERKEVLQYVAELFDPELKAVIEKSSAQERDIISHLQLKRTGGDVFQAIYNSPGSDMETAKGTWWGAFNGVTYTVDHKMGRGRDAAMNKAWFGRNAMIKRNALDLAVKYAKAA